MWNRVDDSRDMSLSKSCTSTGPCLLGFVRPRAGAAWSHAKQRGSPASTSLHVDIVVDVVADVAELGSAFVCISNPRFHVT